MGWLGEHRGFVVETFFKNNESVIATQRAFRRHFRLGRRAPVPDRKTILLWVSNMRATGSTLKRKPPGQPQSVRTPENVQTVRASIEQSPRHSARKHAAALGISDRSVRRMLHQELRMHPYKMMLAQELSERDWKTRRMFPGHLISLHGDIGWPTRSPDLTPCDFILWGYLKAKVHACCPGTIEQLKEGIRQEVAAIPPAMTRKPWTTSMNGFKSLSSITATTRVMLSLKVFEKKNGIICAFYK